MRFVLFFTRLKVPKVVYIGRHMSGLKLPYFTFGGIVDRNTSIQKCLHLKKNKRGL